MAVVFVGFLIIGLIAAALVKSPEPRMMAVAAQAA
jgi:hypothetical protein